MRFTMQDPAVNAQSKYHRLTHWHIWFAWLPVRVGPNDVRWLENVHRKGTEIAAAGDYWWQWEYWEYNSFPNSAPSQPIPDKRGE